MTEEQNANVGAVGTTADTADSQQVGNGLQRPYTFNFKKLSADKLEKHLAELEPESAERARELLKPVEGEEGAVKRPSETHTLTLPDFCAGLDDIAQGIILKCVADFAKSQYIDAYLPVGDHSWEEICEVIRASGGRTASFEYSEETFLLALKGLYQVVLEGTKNQAVAEKFKSAAESKFTKASIMKHIGKLEASLFEKIQKWLDHWAEWEATNRPDTADDVVVVYEMWSSRMKKLAQAEQVTDISEFL